MTSYSQVRQSDVIASMEASLELLERMEEAKAPFTVTHLNLLKNTFPSDMDTSNMIDLNTSMESIKNQIANYAKTTYKKVIGSKPKPAETMHRREIVEQVELLQKGFEGGTGLITVNLTRYRDSRTFIESVIKDTIALNVYIDNSKFRALLLELSMLSTTMDTEVERDNQDGIFKTEETLNKLLKDNVKIIEGLGEISYGLKVNLTTPGDNVVVDLSYTNPSKMKLSFDILSKEDSVKLFDAYIKLRYLSKILVMKPIYADYCQHQAMWAKELAFVLQIMEDDISKFLYTAYTQMNKVTPSSESCINSIDVEITQPPEQSAYEFQTNISTVPENYSLIHKGLTQLRSNILTNKPLATEGFYLSDRSLFNHKNETTVDVKSTVNSTLPVFMDIVKGSLELSNVLKVYIKSNLNIDTIDITKFYPLIVSQQEEDVRLSNGLRLAIQPDFFGNNPDKLKLMVSSVKSINPQIKLEPLNKDMVNYYLNSLRTLEVERSNVVGGLSTGNPEIDKQFFGDIVPLISFIYETYLPLLLEWLTKSFEK